eukprot:gene10661-3285_t
MTQQLTTTVEEIFKTKSVEDVKFISNETRKKINHSESQLRQLIGEKYVNIIQVAKSVVRISELCSKLQTEYETVLNQPLLKNSEIKNIVEEPEEDLLSDYSNNIYLCVQENFLYDASLFFCKGIKHLQETNYKYDEEEIQKFKDKKQFIKSKCHYILGESKNRINDIECAQVLCSILMIESKWTIEDLLKYFLEKRTNLLLSCKNSKDLFYTFQSTILFSNIIFKKLDSLLEKQKIEESMEIIFNLNFLRNEYKEFLNNKLENKIPQQILTLKVKAWTKEMIPVIENLLELYCDNIKSSNEFIQLEEETKKNSNFIEIEYNYISIIDIDLSKIFPSDNLYESKFSKSFLKKQKEFIKKQFEKLNFEIDEEEDGDYSIGEYLWNKPIFSIDELISKYNQRINIEYTNPYSIYQSFDQDINYSMKLNVIIEASTKRVKEIVELKFYESFKLIIEDVSSFIVKERLKKSKNEDSLENFIYQQIFEYIKKISEFISKKLKTTNNFLFFARICQSIKNCIIDTMKELNFGIDKKNNFYEKLDDINLKLHSNWINETSELFKTSILNFEYDSNEFIDSWIEIEIGTMEEKEIINIPGRPSRIIHETLLLICTKIYNIAGYSMEQFILDSLIENMIEKLFSSFQTKSLVELDENILLQIIFDFLFLGEFFFGMPFNKLTRKNNTKNEKIFIQLMNDLIETIDPINYQTYEVEIFKNISLNIQKCSLLFCALTINSYSKKIEESKISIQEDKNPILKLNQVVDHFPLLPIPTDKSLQISPKNGEKIWCFNF